MSAPPASKLSKYFRAALFALILSLIVTLVANSIAVSAFVEESLFPQPVPAYVDLPPYVAQPATGFQFKNASEQQVSQYIRDHSYVSNYNATVFVVYHSANVEPGDRFLFHFAIKDSGINSLSEKKYFYIVAFNPQGGMAVEFPSVSSLFYAPNLPLKKWPTPVWDEIKPYTYDQFFNGTAGGHEIWYRLSIPDDPSSIGSWRTYVLVFDDVYLDRWGKPMVCQAEGGYSFCPPDLDNMVTYTIIRTDVLPNTPPTQPSLTEQIPWPIVQFGPSFIVTYVGYLLRAEQIGTGLVKVKTKLRQHWLFVLVVAVLLISFLLGLRIPCPCGV